MNITGLSEPRLENIGVFVAMRGHHLLWVSVY